MGAWARALDARTDLRRWLVSDAGLTYLRQLSGATAALGVVEPQSDGIDDLRASQLRVLEEGDVFYVEEDMLDLIEFAMESFQGEVLHRNDLLTPAAFALFPRVVRGARRKGESEADAFGYEAIGWEAGSEQVAVSFYSALPPFARDGRLRPAHWTIIPFEKSVSELVAEAEPGHSAPNIDGWLQDVTPVQCFWRMIQEYKEETTSEKAPRASRKRAGDFERDINVVRLRRARAGQDEQGRAPTATQREYRWHVRGHWRNQWYPSLGIHRQKWIRDQIRGPEGLPIKKRIRIFDVSQ